MDIYPKDSSTTEQEIHITNKGKKLTHKIYTDDVSLESEILMDDSEIEEPPEEVNQTYEELEREYYQKKASNDSGH